MCFFLEEPGLILIITHLLYKTALVLAVFRWVLSWPLTLNLSLRFKPFFSASSSPSSSSDNLVLTTFGDAKERMPWVSDACAVCLCELREDDNIRELRNCCHVFHQDCIDRWVEYDGEDDDGIGNHKTCPLCRAPLFTSQTLVWPNNQPSWAVDRLLYLFGDDLLP